MQVLKSAPGVRSLSSLIAAASATRVLDLHALSIAPPDDADYLTKPMFQHPLLNRAIIIKHNARSAEEARLAPRRFNATKVIFPFDPQDLNLGGQYLFVDQPDFINALGRYLNYTDLPIDRDVEVLRILDKLPTLDPFLVRESLNQRQIDVARCYYRFSKSDKADMLGFVAGEIEALIQLCFGEAEGNEKRTRRLSQLLLADQESAELEPLRLTLRMDGAEFSEAMFAWKAFLYYRWRSRSLAAALKPILKSIGRIRPRRQELHAFSLVLTAKQLLESTIATAWREVGQRLIMYDRAFASLTNRENPDSFRHFLIYGSGLFVELGDRIGRLEQVVSFWGERVGGEQVEAMSPDDVLDAIRELLQALSVWPADAGEVDRIADATRGASTAGASSAVADEAFLAMFP